MHSIIRDDNGRLVPVVRPKSWLAVSVKRSRDRTDRIMRSRKQTEGEAGDGAVDERVGSPGDRRAGSDRHPVGGRPALAREV